MNPRATVSRAVRFAAILVGGATLMPLHGCSLSGSSQAPASSDMQGAVQSQPASETQSGATPIRERGRAARAPNTTPREARETDSRAYQSLASRMGVGTYASMEQPGTIEFGLDPERFGERPTPGFTPAGRGGIESPNVSQITHAFEGAAFDPAVSRDGQMVVFASTQHRPTSDIYLKNINSRVITQLTNSEAHDAMPALSPDGSRIAFASNRAGNWDIYVMPASGGRALQVTSDPANEIHPTWSPDGSQLVFNRLGRTTGRWEMWITSTNDASVEHFIGYGLFPEWSPVAGLGPDGSDLIAFQRSRQRGDRAFSIWTMSYREGFAGNMTEIAAAPRAALINPTWSPEAKRLAFAAIPNDGSWDSLPGGTPRNADLYIVDLDGTNLVKVTDGSSVDLMPAWASTSSLFFASDRGGEENLWSLDVSDAVRLAEGNAGPDSPTVATAPEDQ